MSNLNGRQVSLRTQHANIVKGSSLDHRAPPDIAQGGRDIQGFLFPSATGLSLRDVVLLVHLGSEAEKLLDSIGADMKMSLDMVPQVDAISFRGPFDAFTTKTMNYLGSHIPPCIKHVEYRLHDGDFEGLVTRSVYGVSSASLSVPILKLAFEGVFCLGDLGDLTTLVVQPLRPEDSSTFLALRSTIISHLIYGFGSTGMLESVTLPVDLLLNSHMPLRALEDHHFLMSLELTEPTLLQLDTLEAIGLEKLNAILIEGLQSLNQVQIMYLPADLLTKNLLAVLGKMKGVKELRLRASRKGRNVAASSSEDVFLLKQDEDELGFPLSCGLQLLDLGETIPRAMRESLSREYPDLQHF